MIEAWIIVFLALSYGSAVWWLIQEELENRPQPRRTARHTQPPRRAPSPRNKPQPPQVAECQKEKHSAASS